MLVLSLHQHLTSGTDHPSPFEQLLKPSWVSGLICVLASIAIVVASLAALFYKGSSLKILVQLQRDAATTSTNYQAVDTTMANNAFLSNVPLLVFWAGVGIVAYACTSAIVQALRSAAELEQEMSYVHIQRRELIRTAFERLAIRLFSLTVWFIYLHFTIHTVIPYAVAVSYAGTLESSWALGVLYVLGAVSVLIVSMHAHTVLLRLVALRPRLFG